LSFANRPGGRFVIAAVGKYKEKESLSGPQASVRDVRQSTQFRPDCQHLHSRLGPSRCPPSPTVLAWPPDRPGGNPV